MAKICFPFQLLSFWLINSCDVLPYLVCSLILKLQKEDVNVTGLLDI